EAEQGAEVLEVELAQLAGAAVELLEELADPGALELALARGADHPGGERERGHARALLEVGELGQADLLAGAGDLAQGALRLREGLEHGREVARLELLARLQRLQDRAEAGLLGAEALHVLLDRE